MNQVSNALNAASPRTETCGIPLAQASEPEPRIVPFDQVLTFELTGQRDNILSKVTTISSEGHKALSIGLH